MDNLAEHNPEFYEEEGLEVIDGTVDPDRGEAPGVSLEDFQLSLKRMIDDAIDYAEDDLADKRQKAIEAYRAVGLPGDADLDDTRSRAMSRDVHDTVKAILPSLLRIFFGGRDVVAYRPGTPDDEEVAKQATSYVNQVVLNQDNNGFIIGYNAFKDALIKALGVFVWWWDESSQVVSESYTGLGEFEFYMLVGDPSVIEVYNYEEVYDQNEQAIDSGVKINCMITREQKKGKVKIEAVPPEERLINRTARSIEDATLYGRRREMTVSDLVEMGFKYSQVIKFSSGSGNFDDLENNEEKIERLDGENYREDNNTTDPSQRTVHFAEVYVRADLDADGIAELYKVCCAGPGHEILEYAGDDDLAIELTEDIPYAELCPDPEPHLATGHSVSESIEDVQTIKSNLLRGMLDSLSRAIFPREEVVEHQVNIDDVLNPEIGAVIRAKQPGMVREIVTPFMGKECLPILGYYDEVKANRTGVSAATQGLDPGTLQSSTAKAVEATVTASQTQIEMIARIFAQTGMCRLFNGILRTISAHQDQPRTVRLTNGWATMDPRVWEAEMDAHVEVALGRGTDSDRLAMLNVVAQKQETILQTLGPNNPLCTLAEYRATLAEIISIAGYYNPDKFFVPLDHSQIMQQMSQELGQSKEQLMQAQQIVAQLQFELQNHSGAEDAETMANADKKRAETFKTLVEALQTAMGTTVNPQAADDETSAARRLGF